MLSKMRGQFKMML